MLLKRNLRQCLLLLCLLCTTLPASAQPDAETDSTRTRIAFGSCNNQREPQPLWQSIAASQPDLWVWLGDNIYADTRNMTLKALYYRQQQLHPG